MPHEAEALTCIVCLTLEQNPDEPQLHRLVRFYERKVADLSNRLLTSGDRVVLERRITELEATIEQLNRRTR